MIDIMIDIMISCAGVDGVDIQISTVSTCINAYHLAVNIRHQTEWSSWSGCGWHRMVPPLNVLWPCNPHQLVRYIIVIS